MDYHVEFQLQFRDDEAIAQELAKFFSPVATPQIQRGKETATKSLEVAITIFVSIVGVWATERYVLDPLADRTEEWLKSISAVWQKSNSKRKFNITVQFEDTADKFEVHVSDTSDPDVLKRTWMYVEKARQVFQTAKEQGVTLDQVRLLPDGSQDMLIVGYTNGRPRYTVDLENGTLRPIRQESWESKGEDGIAAELWVLAVLIRRLDYLKWLVEIGHNVSLDEIAKEEGDVQSAKIKFRR